MENFEWCGRQLIINPPYKFNQKLKCGHPGVKGLSKLQKLGILSVNFYNSCLSFVVGDNKQAILTNRLELMYC